MWEGNSDMEKLKGLKKDLFNVLAFRDVSNGFSVEAARNWKFNIWKSYSDKSQYSYKQIRWAVRRGFLPEQVEGLQLTEDNYKNTISARDYAYLYPLNGIYSKWISDRITIDSIFKPFRDKMPECYYHILKRNAETLIIPLRNDGDTLNDVLSKVKEKKKVALADTRLGKTKRIEWKDSKFYADDNELTEKEFERMLYSSGDSIVIMEAVEPSEEFKGSIISIIAYNEQGDNLTVGESYITFDGLYEDKKKKAYAYIDQTSGKISDAVFVEKGKRIKAEKYFYNQKPFPVEVPYWDEIKTTVDDIGRFVPQLEFFGLQIMICEGGFKIVEILNNPPYPKSMPFSKGTSDYLKYKVKQKEEAYKGFAKKSSIGWKKIKLKIRAIYAKTFFPQGTLPYLTIKFPGEVWKDFKTNKDTSFKEKIWALRHGFISYRIHQYGITEDNYDEFISDFEYRWLRHINPEYREWMEDKITVKYICSDYNHCFPEYYYHISLKNGNNKVVSMMDCPKHYTNTYDDIFELVKEKGSLALKPDEGSHGDGFYKFSYSDGKYYLNHKEAHKEEVLNILQDVNNQYLVTEYIDMHPVIKNIYSGAVNTIRMIVFKKDGKNPQIGNAYMRFGSKRTGAVDNMGAGGMFAKIDIETGKFYDAKIIEANEIKPCLYHPDTNVKIEGYLPNWDKVKEEVLSVARNIPQLEYFGFDLAITSDGLKFPEINRFPDYPAIEKLSPKTMDYLLYKLEQKKIAYGGRNFRGTRLVKLPKR